ncbi:winged helix-turn-helix domain-containing protein, partial [Cognatilysobacter lacus]
MADATGHVPADPAIYRFGDVCVDTQACLVTRAGEPQPLEPKAYAVLITLLRHAGELVPRETLLDAVWGHRHVTPGVLTRSIAQLRHALGDDPHVPRYIRTRHALGYSFVATLEFEVGDRAPGSPAAPAWTAPVASPASPVTPPVPA